MIVTRKLFIWVHQSTSIRFVSKFITKYMKSRATSTDLASCQTSRIKPLFDAIVAIVRNAGANVNVGFLRFRDVGVRRSILHFGLFASFRRALNE